MIPSCFSQPNTQSSSKKKKKKSSRFCESAHSLVTTIYQTQLCNTPTHLTLSWSKTLSSHSLTIHANHTFSITISLYKSTFPFFRSQHRSKSIKHSHNNKIKLHWNFSRAEFFNNSAEPDSRFFLAISCNGKIQFLLGDSTEATNARKTHEPILLSRREHVFGSESYVSRVVFMGCKHEIGIECNGKALTLKVDGEVRLVVKRLCWKFRGNQKFFVDGVEVEFYWDVLSLVADNGGHGVFVFQVGDGNVWPEMVGAAEKRLMRKGLLLLSSSGSGVLQWAEESSDGGGGRSSCSSSSSGSNGGGFSLLLYAWNK